MQDIVSALIPLTFVAMFFSERLFRGRAFATPPRYRLKGFFFFFLAAVVNVGLPVLFVDQLASHAPIHLGGLGLWAAPIVFVVSDLVAYWLHRAQHNFFPLWRWTHQWHHSVEAVDMASANVFHPLDMALAAAVGAVIPAMLGVTADAAALAGFVLFFYAMFQHWNVRTPRWLGYVIQRPESHCVHHERGVHAYNYANLPLWDLVFGTFRNPATWDGEAGFYNGASTEMGRMLIGRDVGQPARSSAPLAQGT